MAKIPIGSTLPTELKEKAKKASKIQGKSFSKFVEDAVKLYADFDNYFIKELEKYSASLKIEESIILQNVFMKYQAEQVSKKRVFGIDSLFNIDSVPEFRFTDTGIMTGKELLEYLVIILESKYRELKYYRDRFGTIDSEDKTLKPIKIHWANEFEFLASKFKRLAKEIEISNPPMRNGLSDIADILLNISQRFRASS